MVSMPIHDCPRCASCTPPQQMCKDRQRRAAQNSRLEAPKTKCNHIFSLGCIYLWSCILCFYLLCSIIGLETNSIQTMLMAQGATTASNALSKTPVLQALQQQSQTNLHVSNYSFGSLCSRGSDVFLCLSRFCKLIS